MTLTELVNWTLGLLELQLKSDGEKKNTLPKIQVEGIQADRKCFR